MIFQRKRMIPGARECSEKSPIFKEHIERYRFASHFVRKKKVLDLACGAGYDLMVLDGLG